MTDKHLSTQFDAELSGISNRVLEMGGLVESQLAQAVYALTHFSGETASQVLVREEDSFRADPHRILVTASIAADIWGYPADFDSPDIP